MATHHLPSAYLKTGRRQKNKKHFSRKRRGKNPSKNGFAIISGETGGILLSVPMLAEAKWMEKKPPSKKSEKNEFRSQRNV